MMDKESVYLNQKERYQFHPIKQIALILSWFCSNIFQIKIEWPRLQSYDRKDRQMELLNHLLQNLNDFLYGNILIALLIITGIYFTIRTKFVQLRLLPEACRILNEKTSKEGGVSSFQALMISTASRVGTGNIAGVAAAIAAGGPGAIVWMWILAIIGSASAFIESTLSQVYKTKDGEGYRGGPAYYIEKALGMRWLGIIFAILLIACFAIGFNALQSYNVSSAFEVYAATEQTKKIVSIIVGIVLAAATAYTIFGGVHRIGIISSAVVPVMAILYILLGAFITIRNIHLMPEIFSNVFQDAFNFKAFAGGIAGTCVMYGIKRGLFSNEAGMGSAPNASAAADVSHPAKQGLVQMLSVYIDTLIICTTTAMMLLVYGVEDGLTGMPYVQAAVSSEVGNWGIHFITVSILLFAFSSLIGNYSYAESNLKFICDNKVVVFIFRVACLIPVFFGALASFGTVWDLADVLMGFMAIVNIFAILLLGGVACKTLKDYSEQKREGKDPKFNPRKLGIKNTECWDEE